MVDMVATGTSAARVAANRANARRSTGPRTAVGKARSRANAVKHGLTGAGVALPGEDAARVEERFVELQADMAPSDMLGRVLVQQMALLSVRVERAARHEAACVGMAIRHAAVEFDLARLAEVDRLFDTIAANPAENRRRLLTTVEGVDRLVAALGGAREQICEGQAQFWGEAERVEIEAFFGRGRTFFPVTRTCALLEALGGDCRWLTARERDRVGDPVALVGSLCTELIGLIDAELARLAAIRPDLDPTLVAHDRTTAADRALFDPGPDAANARKYAALAARQFQRALRDFHQNEANFAEDADLEARVGLIEIPPVESPRSIVTDTVGPFPNEPNPASANCQNEPNAPPAVVGADPIGRPNVEAAGPGSAVVAAGSAPDPTGGRVGAAGDGPGAAEPGDRDGQPSPTAGLPIANLPIANGVARAGRAGWVLPITIGRLVAPGAARPAGQPTG